MDTLDLTQQQHAETTTAGGDVAVSRGRAPAIAAPQDGVAGSLLTFVAQALDNPNIDERKLEALLRMQREIVADDARGQFNRSLHAAQLEMPRVKKNGTIDLNGGRAISFATWEDVDTAVRPIMQRHGFSVTFSSETKTEQGICWTATHRHIAGHSEQNSIILPMDTGPGRSPIQAAGSTSSYAKRYLVEDFYNIVREKVDDDGKMAGVRYITDAQVQELKGLLNETKTEMGRWLEMVPGTRSLEEIEVGGFTACKNSLLQKRAALAAKAGRP